MPRPDSLSSRHSADAEATWSRVLNELERALDPEAGEPDEGGADTDAGQEEHAPYARSGMWRAPGQLPVMPESLRPRAEALQRRQQQQAERLTAERDELHSQLRALRSVPQPRSASTSVYLDVTG